MRDSELDMPRGDTCRSWAIYLRDAPKTKGDRYHRSVAALEQATTSVSTTRETIGAAGEVQHPVLPGRRIRERQSKGD
jgi:hypothetical protein